MPGSSYSICKQQPKRNVLMPLSLQPKTHENCVCRAPDACHVWLHTKSAMEGTSYTRLLHQCTSSVDMDLHCALPSLPSRQETWQNRREPCHCNAPSRIARSPLCLMNQLSNQDESGRCSAGEAHHTLRGDLGSLVVLSINAWRIAGFLVLNDLHQPFEDAVQVDGLLCKWSAQQNLVLWRVKLFRDWSGVTGACLCACTSANNFCCSHQAVPCTLEGSCEKFLVCCTCEDKFSGTVKDCAYFCNRRHLAAR